MSREDRPPVIGVDVGGTKVAAGAVALGGAGEVVERRTDVSSPQAVLDGIEAAVEEVARRAGRPDAVGVGVPSQIDFRAGLVVASVNIPLHGVPLRDELEDRLGCPVYVDNDANCAALAEARLIEEARGGGPVSHLVMFTLGTGVGGGLVLDGRIFRGARGLGAELGHTVVDRQGPECPGNCPNRGCLEALCSGTALAREARTLAARSPDSTLGRLAAEGKAIAGDTVVAAARDGDGEAAELLESLGRWLGIGIANAVNVFEPDYVVIGGGLSAAADVFLDAAHAEAAARALPEAFRHVEITLALGGAAAGVIGAGALAQQEQGG